MARNLLLPGFRFHPTDVELVMFYLIRKVMGKPLRLEVISEIDLYKFSPWDLPEKCFWKSNDLEWYFFCPRDRKYTNGPRTNRATEIGYWKTTGKDRPICHKSRTVGMKKTLVFHIGRAPHGERTNWVMHEYRLEDKELIDRDISQDSYVLCKIFEKSGPGPKNGERHGAPFNEEEWEDDSDDMINSSLAFFQNPTSPPTAEDCQNLVVGEGNSSPELFNLEELLQELSENDGRLVSHENGVDETQGTGISHTSGYGQDAVSPEGYDGIFSGLGDIASQEQNNNLYSHGGLEDVLDQMLNVDDGHLIGLQDLYNPQTPGSAEYGISDNLCASCDILNVPVFEVDNNVCGLGYEIVHVQKAEETGDKCVQQTFPEGEQHDVFPTLEHISGEGGSYSKLQYLLDSIPAPPASAAEYSPSKVEDPKNNLSPYGSPIHFKAEVTVRCMCTRGLLSDQLGTHSCACCHRGNPSKKLGSEPSSCGGGFVFVFLLGMVSALMWVFLLMIGAKFGRYAWKKFIQPF